MPTLCRYTWPAELDAIIREEAARADVPLDIAYAFIAVESGFDPNAHALTPFEDSVGLLQLNRRGGQGTGYTVDQLRDPHTNLRIGLPPIAAAFRSAWSPTIDPYELIYLTATRSGHPGPVARQDARIVRTANAWSCFFGGVGVLGPGGAPAAAFSPGPAQSLAGAGVSLVLVLVAMPAVVLYQAAQVGSSLALRPGLRPPLASRSLITPTRTLPTLKRRQRRRLTA